MVGTFASVLVVVCTAQHGHTQQPLVAPVVEPEAAMVWPQPQNQVLESTSGYLAISARFAFIAANPAAASSDTLQQAMARYRAIVFQRGPEPMSWVGRCDPDEHQLRWPCPPPPVVPSRALVLLSINVSIHTADDTLSLETSERYTLTVGFPSATLVADTAYGAMRGLESFAQLVQPDHSIRAQSITDFPRFPFRATMIDTSRHWLPVPLLKAHLDAMSYNKMNVLHMHISDMPSFPFVSTSLPQLSAQGAFDSKHVYTPAVIAELIAYAKARGVRVIPEFDVPSHTYPSWDPVGVRAGNSTLLANCSEYPFGFLRVDLDSTYDFLGALLEDVSKAFPDAVYNIGGDEMNAACWNQSAEVARFMEAQQLNGSELTGYFTKKLFRVVQDR
jgi:hexosaminidase